MTGRPVSALVVSRLRLPRPPALRRGLGPSGLAVCCSRSALSPCNQSVPSVMRGRPAICRPGRARQVIGRRRAVARAGASPALSVMQHRRARPRHLSQAPAAAAPPHATRSPEPARTHHDSSQQQHRHHDHTTPDKPRTQYKTPGNSHATTDHLRLCHTRAPGEPPGDTSDQRRKEHMTSQVITTKHVEAATAKPRPPPPNRAPDQPAASRRGSPPGT